jgi:hypothetical protein
MARNFGACREAVGNRNNLRPRSDAFSLNLLEVTATKASLG